MRLDPADIFDDVDPEDLTPVTLVPAKNPARIPQWDKRLVVDVCLGTDEDAILDEYGLTAHDFARIQEDPVFATAVKRLQEELQEEGATFRLKCKLQAEAMLEEAWRMAHAPDTDPRVKEKLMSNMVRWAGWDNPASGGKEGGAGFHININLGAREVAGVTYDNEG